MYKISDFLSLNNISVNLIASNKDELINKMIELSFPNLDETTFSKLKNIVEKREQVISTGVGKGIAIPHCHTDLVIGNKISLAILKNPVDFDSVDNEPVDIVFFIISNDNLLDMYLKLLSRICRLLSHIEFKDNLKQLNTSENIIKFIQEEENKIINGK